MLHLKNSPVFVSFVLILLITSCGSSEIGESKDVNQATIYQDYKIVYEEGVDDDLVEVWSQFRFAGDDGTTLVLTKPSNITFDGQPIKVDSSDLTGAFYRLQLPVKNFFGKHRFLFTDINENKFVNEFSFDSFRLSALPATVSKTQPLNIQFEAAPLAGDDYIELAAINTDSTFSIKHLASASGNVITIPVSELQRQKGNKLKLEMLVCRKIPLQQFTKEGGQLIIYYSPKPLEAVLTE
jgi:hypothetical protein